MVPPLLRVEDTYWNNELGDFNAVPGVTDLVVRLHCAKLGCCESGLLEHDAYHRRADGKPLSPWAARGKTIIITTMQVILNVIDHGFNIAEAIEAGRIHHQWLPDTTSVESNALCRHP